MERTCLLIYFEQIKIVAIAIIRMLDYYHWSINFIRTLWTSQYRHRYYPRLNRYLLSVIAYRLLMYILVLYCISWAPNFTQTLNRLVKKSFNFRHVLFLCFREAIEDYLVIFGLALLLALILGIELDTAGKNASRPFASGMECMIPAVHFIWLIQILIYKLMHQL